MLNKNQQSLNTYIAPEWKIWHCLFVLIMIILCGQLLAIFKDSVQRTTGFILLANVVQFACFFLLPLYIAGVIYNQPAAAMGIQQRPFTYGLSRSVMWGLTLYTLNVICSAIMFKIFPDQPQEIQFIMEAMLKNNNPFELAGLVFCVTVLAPVGEEIFFRAFLFSAVESRFGRWAGIIVSAAVFAAVHESFWHFPPMFIGGCGFALLYAKYRDITMNIIAHCVWNSIAVMLMFAFIYGQ